MGMSLTDEAEQHAKAVVRHPVMEHLTRAGFVGYGITHLLLAWVALQSALQRPATDADQSGALGLLAAGGFGRILLVLIALGFVAMTVWQVLAAAVGHGEFSGGRRLFERAASAGRALLNAYFGWTEGNPIVYLLKFLAFGEGDTAPVTREVLRQAEANPLRRPRIHVG